MPAAKLIEIESLRSRPDETRSATRWDSIPCWMEMTHDERTWGYTDFNRTQTAEAFFARAVVLVEGLSDQLALEALVPVLSPMVSPIAFEERG
jgi:predicted ATP-dependent endonuclease of OLD family